MIKVDKDYTKIPLGLGSAEATEYIVKSLKEKQNHDVNKDIYKHKTVKESLNAIYKNKCGYCEIRLGVEFYQTIDHYRPKKSVKENRAHSGYYWLSYEWSNLINSCHRCNRKKRDSFPVENEADRIHNHQKDREKWSADSASFLSERPLLLNPEIDEPYEHLEISMDGKIVEKTIRGDQTIEKCELNRDALVLERRSKIEKFKTRFNETAHNIKKLYNKGIISEKHFTDIIIILFTKIFDSLQNDMKPDQVYSFVANNLFIKYDYFFIQSLPAGAHQKILHKAFNLFIKSEGDK